MEFLALPLRTHLVKPGEDLARMLLFYAGRIFRPGDVVFIAETAVAIAQGRAFRSERVRPRILARLLSRFPGKDGSLATPQAMELALRERGTGRILLGCAAALLGKMMGRRGDFFRVAGRDLAQIDDIGGQLPPFDRCIVLGPSRPRELARELKERTGMDVGICDANDLGRVDILASTAPYPPEELARALKSNPQGNEEEMTPLVILRPVPREPGAAEGRSPLRLIL